MTDAGRGQPAVAGPDEGGNPRRSLTTQGTGACVAARKLQLGIDCAIWGPGSIEVAHKPNEYLPKSDFAAARVLIERAIDRFCVQVP